MSDIPAFPYEDLWGERVLRSVANLTRKDGQEFLDLASRIRIRVEVSLYPLSLANEALEDFRRGVTRGAAVLRVGTESPTAEGGKSSSPPGPTDSTRTMG